MQLQLISCALLESLRLNFTQGRIRSSEDKSTPRSGLRDKSRSESLEVKCNGCNEHNRCKVSNIRIVKCHTGRVLLYYSEGYKKKGTPKVFRRCEIVIIILRPLVRVNESSKEYY